MNKFRQLTRILLVAALASGLGPHVYSQVTAGIGGGFGIPEIFNLNIRLNIKQSQVAFRIGG